MLRLTTAIAALVLISTSATAQAVRPPLVRQGFGISVGLGAGSAGTECDFCTSERTTALSGYLRLGGYRSQQVFLGFESNGWTNSEDGVDETVGFYSGVVLWYPNPEQSFYVKGGIGLAAYSATDGIDEVTGTALGLSGGIGYDVRAGNNFSLTPYVNVLLSTKGELSVNDVSSGLNVSTNVIQFGLGLTWH